MSLARPVAALGALVVFWLCLVGEVSIGQVALGAALAAAALSMSRPFAAAPLPPGRLVPALGLALTFAYDIFVANLAVARIVLSPHMRIQPCFVSVPLEIGEPKAIALLASMVTLTPGTVAVEMDAEARVLTVHALVAPDPEETARIIKQRYEARIKEIFQC